MSFVEQALRKIQSQGKPVETERRAAPSAPGGTQPARAAATTNALAAISQRAPLNIDLNRLREIGLLPRPDQERAVTRHLRAIKHGLLRKMANDPIGPQTVPRTIMVTSSLPNDGKTFCSLNLAISLAMEKDVDVLLVDTDVLKPQITTEFGLADKPGLIDVLNDSNADVLDCVRATQLPGLYFLPAGSLSEEATELLFSERMLSVTRQLVNLQSNLLVVFDSSPMLVTVEARALAGLMSQILLVVRAGHTPQHMVRQTLDLLADGASRVSLLLNDARDSHNAEYVYGVPYGDAHREIAKT